MRPVHLLLGLAALVLASGAFWLLTHDAGEGGSAARNQVAGPEIADPTALSPARPVSPAVPPRSGATARSGVEGELLVHAEPAADGEAWEPREWWIRGRVVDRRGQPVAGASVLAARNDRRTQYALDSHRFRERYAKRLFSADTDAEGRFELTGPLPGLLRVAVRAEGFAPFDRDDFELPPRADVDLGDLELVPGVTLAGRVIDEKGAGVADAELGSIPTERDFGDSLRAMATPVGRTDADGRFRITRLAPGPWKLLVRSTDHPDHLAEGLVEPSPGRLEGVEIRLAPGLTLSGTVVGRSGTPLSVRATPIGAPSGVNHGSRPDEREASVDGSGRFELTGLSGLFAYELAARATSDDGRRPIWLTPPVIARPGDTGVRLFVREAATLRFRVVDAATSEPIENYNVWMGATLDERTWRSRLESGDDFEVDPLTSEVVLEGIQSTGESGRTGIELRAGGYYFERRDGLRMTPGATLDLGNIALTPLPRVAVRVLSAETGDPIDRATVHVANLDRAEAPRLGEEEGGPATRSPSRTTTTTDENGDAFAPGSGGTQLFVWATHPDFAPSDVRTVVLGGAVRPEIELRLSRGATVIALVRDEDRRPLAGRVLQRNEYREEVEGGSWQGAGGRTGAVTDGEGRATFDLLRPGLHRFAVVPPRRGRIEKIWKEVRVADGEVREIELDTPALFTLSGRVAEAGFPLSGARVWLHPGHKRSWRLTLLGPRANDPLASTGADGRYEIREVPVGEHLLVVDHPTRSMDSEIALGFDEAGNYAYDVDLPITRISGRVVDTEGTPLEGLEISVMRQEDGRKLRDSMLGLGERQTASSELQRTTRTDRAGRFEARGVVAEEPLVVVVRGKDVRTERSDPFEVELDGVRDGIEIVARPAGSLRVTVKNADGSPAPGVTVNASFRGRGRNKAEAHHVPTNGQGRVLLEGLTPGPWRVRVDPPERSDADDPLPAQEIDIERRKRAELHFQLP